MNRSIFRHTLTLVACTSILLFPVSVSAFWPFDGTGNGQVQGSTTERGGFFGLMQRMMRPFSGPNAGSTNLNPSEGKEAEGSEGRLAPSGATGAVGLRIPKNRLDEAVKNGKITQTQEDEIISRLESIRVKQQELMALEKSLASWMKTNNISTSFFAPPQRMMQGSGATGANGQFPPQRGMMQRSQGVPSGEQRQSGEGN